MASTDKPFRVIVVGGGVGGLTASHALQLAGIDHVVLEKGQIAPPLGASIGIYPQGSRILSQIGCLDAVERECVPLGKSINILPDGRLIAKSDFFAYSRSYHGYPIPVLERRRFLEILYEQLPDKSFLKSGIAVVDIEDNAHGVKAILSDGTVEEGDLLIGVDGVHSLTRSLMWRNANTAVPGMITTAEKKSLFCDWTALVGFSPTLPSMSNCDMACTHYPGKSFLVIGQKTYTFWFVFFRNSTRRHWPATSPRWTSADADARAAECASCPISDTSLFGELWRSRVRGELVNVEEGLFEHMYFGRTVLAGDAVHKMTPNVGLGGNSSMESIAVLCNALVSLLQRTPPGSKPSQAALTALLQSYQAERSTRMRQIIDFSAFATKVQAWENPLYKAVSRIVPYLPDDTFAKQAAGLIKGAPKLDYVPLPERGRFRGTVKWEFDDDDDDDDEEVEVEANGSTHLGQVKVGTTKVHAKAVVPNGFKLVLLSACMLLSASLLLAWRTTTV